MKPTFMTMSHDGCEEPSKQCGAFGLFFFPLSVQHAQALKSNFPTKAQMTKIIFWLYELHDGETERTGDEAEKHCGQSRGVSNYQRFIHPVW